MRRRRRAAVVSAGQRRPPRARGCRSGGDHGRRRHGAAADRRVWAAAVGRSTGAQACMGSDGGERNGRKKIEASVATFGRRGWRGELEVLPTPGTK